MKKLKILFLSPRNPYPVIGGDRVKSYHLLKHLASKHEVKFIFSYQGSYNLDEMVAHLKSLGVEPLPFKFSPITSGLKAALSLVNASPLEISYYYFQKMQNAIDLALNEFRPDLTFAFFMRTAKYIYNKDIKKILIAEDCRTEYQKRSYQSTNNKAQKLVRYMEYKALVNYEHKIIDKFDYTTLVSDSDISLMKNLNPNGNYYLLTNGTDINKFTYVPITNRANEILFAGKLDVLANVTMIADMMNNIMPLIWKLMPNIKLRLVGANPSAEIMKYKCENVIIDANVPEMVPYLQQAAVFLHPHKGGSGIQNKLIEAMATGLPVVTSITGNQGINGTDKQNLMIAKTNQEFADKTIELLNNKELAQNISANARKHIIENLSWQRVFNDLDTLIEKVLA